MERSLQPCASSRRRALLLTLALAAGCGSNEPKLPPDAGADMEVKVELTYDTLLAACVRLSACGIERHPQLEECMKNFKHRIAALGRRALFERLYDCANKGQGDCKIIRECLGFAGRPKPCDATYQARCEGEVAYNCDLIRTEGWEQGVDCARGGLKCAVKESGTTREAICGGGPCSAGKDECRQRKLFRCIGGALEINDCPEQQLQCRDPAVPECEGMGRTCPPVAPKCEGEVLVKCMQGYFWEVDCSKEPGEKICDVTSQACIGKHQECAIGFFNECQGDTLVACIDGKKRPFDCKQMGFLGCEKASTYGAYCRAEQVYE